MKTLSDTLIARLDDPLRSSNIPWKKKLLVRWKEWTSKADHSQGFTLLGELDLTDYVPRGGIAEITEEIENDIDPNEANYGVIKASQFNQELSEETIGTEDMTKGELLKTIHAETGSSFSGFYKYSGSDIHLWELVLQVGDIDNDDYVEYSWILGWLFDPDNELQPRWIGSNRNVSKFTLTACSLLYWLKDVGSAVIGDYSNKSGVYYDDSEDEAGDLNESGEDEYYTRVCNYPLVPVLRFILHEAGVVDSNITKLDIPPDTGGGVDFSTLEYETFDSEGTELNSEVPNLFHWKTVGNIDYWIWHIGKITSVVDPIRVTMVNTVTGEIQTGNIDIFTGTAIGSAGRVYRLWYPGTGDAFYTLVNAGGTWYVIETTLQGTTISGITSSQDNDEQALTVPTNWGFYWLQCDIDTVASPKRLWACIEDTSGHLTTRLGYFSLDSGSWTTLETINSGTWTYNTRIEYDGGTNSDKKVGGFRVLRSAGGDYAVCWFLWAYSTDWELLFYLYDDSKTSVITASSYDFTAYTKDGKQIFVKDWTEARWPVTGQRGSMGGFYDSGADEFCFQLPSIEIIADDGHKEHAGVCKRWSPGASWSVTTETVSSGGFTMLRTFSSHGTAAIEHSTGFIHYIREGGTDYSCYIKPCSFELDGTTTLHVPSNWFQMGDGTASYPYRKWPVLSAPSITVSSAGTSYPKHSWYRAFLVYKKSGTDGVDAQKRSFLTTNSTIWYPNFAYDFTENNPSIAEVLKDIASCYGLIMKIGHDSTIIRPRNDTGTPDKVLTRDHYKFLGQADEVIKGYDGVEITCYMGGASNPYTAGNTDSTNVLSVETDFLLPSRASKRATNLWAEWKYNQVVYKFEARCLPYIEPGDLVTIPRILPPGDDHENFTGVIMRSSLKELNSPIEVKTIDTSGEAVL